MRVSETPVCTYVDCKEPGEHQQKAKDGAVWASLCDEHAVLLDNSITSGNQKQILSVWVKAQGGAKKAARRMRCDYLARRE